MDLDLWGNLSFAETVPKLCCADDFPVYNFCDLCVNLSLDEYNFIPKNSLFWAEFYLKHIVNWPGDHFFT